MVKRDIRWLAGWLEGEGTFYSRLSKGKYKYPQVVAVSTDFDVIKAAAALMNATVYGPYQYAVNKRPHWQARTYGDKAIVLMRKLYPRMGQRRRKQIEKVCSS